jgi:hypothetical protein
MGFFMYQRTVIVMDFEPEVKDSLPWIEANFHDVNLSRITCSGKLLPTASGSLIAQSVTSDPGIILLVVQGRGTTPTREVSPSAPGPHRPTHQ